MQIMKDVVFEKLRGFSPLQRVLLSTEGTLQGTLSALFGAPVTVTVIRQDEIDGGITRHVNLVCSADHMVVCRAVTDAQVTDPKMRRLILEGKAGLGQIMAMVGATPSFALDEAGQDDDAFWRRYRLGGGGFSLRIYEVFPKPRFERVEPK
jgi:chorismate-pyruvate lyase